LRSISTIPLRIRKSMVQRISDGQKEARKRAIELKAMNHELLKTMAASGIPISEHLLCAMALRRQSEFLGVKICDN